MIVVWIGFYVFNFFYYVYVFGNFIECVVFLVVNVFIGVIEKIIVINVNEKLCGSWMRVVSMCYGNGVFFICYVVVCFIFDSCFGVFLIYICSEIIVLNYKICDNMVENGVVVKIIFYVW